MRDAEILGRTTEIECQLAFTKLNIVIPSKLDEIKYQKNELNNKDNPLLIGTIVHRFLELMVLHKFSSEPKTLITAVLKEYGISSDTYYLDMLTKIIVINQVSF